MEDFFAELRRFYQRHRRTFELIGPAFDVGAGLVGVAVAAGVLLKVIPLGSHDNRRTWWLILAGCLGFAAWQFRRKLLPRLRGRSFRFTRRYALTGVAVVFVCAVVLVGWYSITWAASPLGMRQTFYYPDAFADSAWLLLLLLASFMIVGGMSVAPSGSGLLGPPASGPSNFAWAYGRSGQDGSENARYLALGCAMLAVVGYALARSQAQLTASHSSLLQFFAMLPWRWYQLPGQYALGLGVLTVLALLGLFRALTGLPGPFPRIGLRRAGSNIFWLIAGAGLWLWGAFPPDSSDAGSTANFGLHAFYLFAIVNSGLTIFLLVGRGGGKGPGPVQEDIKNQKFKW